MFCCLDKNVNVKWSMNNERRNWSMQNVLMPPLHIDQLHCSLFMDHLTFTF
jgi:hypothetical protein